MTSVAHNGTNYAFKTRHKARNKLLKSNLCSNTKKHKPHTKRYQIIFKKGKHINSNTGTNLSPEALWTSKKPPCMKSARGKTSVAFSTDRPQSVQFIACIMQFYGPSGVVCRCKTRAGTNRGQCAPRRRLGAS